jgi:hypothetical protein
MSTKIAIITDIHGNWPALRAALYEIDSLHEVQHIYCLGDMIGIGPDTNEVLQALFSREDMTYVSGNHDEAVLALIKGEAYPESHFHSKLHHEWIAERMDKSFVPIQRIFEKGNELPNFTFHMRIVIQVIHDGFRPVSHIVKLKYRLIRHNVINWTARNEKMSIRCNHYCFYNKSPSHV